MYSSFYILPFLRVYHGKPNFINLKLGDGLWLALPHYKTTLSPIKFIMILQPKNKVQLGDSYTCKPSVQWGCSLPKGIAPESITLSSDKEIWPSPSTSKTSKASWHGKIWWFHGFTRGLQGELMGVQWCLIINKWGSAREIWCKYSECPGALLSFSNFCVVSYSFLRAVSQFGWTC